MGYRGNFLRGPLVSNTTIAAECLKVIGENKINIFSFLGSNSIILFVFSFTYFAAIKLFKHVAENLKRKKSKVV